MFWKVLTKNFSHFGRATVIWQSFEWIDFCENRKNEYRAIIKYLFFKGNTPTHIKDKLDAIYEDSTPLFTILEILGRCL